jgi:hypothetical protein
MYLKTKMNRSVNLRNKCRRAVSLLFVLGSAAVCGCGNPAIDSQSPPGSGRSTVGASAESSPAVPVSSGKKSASMSNEEIFWNWFCENEDELFDFERNQEATLDRLDDALHKVDPDLTFEFGPKKDARREFIISAGGLKRAFPSVVRLSDASPKLRRFSVIAFRPRRKTINDIELSGLKIRSSQVFFGFIKDNDPSKVGVLLFIPGYVREDSRYGQVGYLFLDEALGEYEMETKVGHIEMLPHESNYFEGSRPIKQMAEQFDEAMRSREANH